jgi:hypothetical protein
MAYDLKKSRGNLASNNINYLARYEIDRRSIYVGNLPYDVENLEDILREAASIGGIVDAVQVIRKPPKNGKLEPESSKHAKSDRSSHQRAVAPWYSHLLSTNVPMKHLELSTDW